VVVAEVLLPLVQYDLYLREEDWFLENVELAYRISMPTTRINSLTPEKGDTTMPTRNAKAQWKGTIKDGEGSLSLESGWEGPYSFATRFQDEEGTNPEELIGAAHAGCLSMALSGELTEAGYEPESIETSADVTIEEVDGGFEITTIALTTEARVPGIDAEEFDRLAAGAAENCPVSKALSAVKEIRFEATLLE
jgi:osmotically inducible protein OsmC